MDTDNIFEGLKENKKSLIVILIMIVILIVVSILNLVLDNNKNNEELDMEGVITSLAEIYYEEHYYPQVQSSFENNYIEKLRQDEKDGIELNLRDIVVAFGEIDPTRFYQKGNYCNFIGTYATIYPKYPYDIDDYKIDVTLSCVEKLSD